MLLFLSTLALAGYGDAEESFPSWMERDIHLWTNAARVDPEAFEEAYGQGGCSTSDFSSDELTPKAPVQWNYSLNQAARSHSADMYDNNFFDHTGSDGSSPSDRAAEFGYSGGASENIADGYSDGFDVVMRGWMCSTTGHRENIMTGGWDEIGTGVKGSKMTQNFGTGGVGTRHIAMGLHSPERPLGMAEFLGDYYHSSGPPEAYEVVLNGIAHPMEKLYGADDVRGIYGVEIDIDSDACNQYYFRVAAGGEEVLFPEDGSYGWGDCAWDDEESEWLDRQMSTEELSEDELRDRFQLVGCSTGGAAVGGLALLPLMVFVRRRR